MKRVYLSFLLSVISSSLWAQYTVPQVVSTGGGSGQNGKLNLSWTVGEPVIETYQSGKLSVTQGFHQGKMKINKQATAKILEEEFAEDPSLDIQAYPNPTYDYVTLILNVGEVFDYTYGIYDMAGNQLVHGPIEYETISTDFTTLAKGNYILLVRQRDIPVKVFQIIKN